jgi:phosphoribosyl 1,2-cyclic phosphodiesterase
MSLFIASLNSGSNGNCYYIGNEEEAVLVDAGISCRETEQRMLRLGLTMQKVKAIFVSHEHIDHIRGIPVLAKKYALPVYITHGTLGYSGMQLENTVPFRAFEPVAIGRLQIHAFPKHHDASDPHSFIITTGPLPLSPEKEDPWWQRPLVQHTGAGSFQSASPGIHEPFVAQSPFERQ